MKRSSLLFFSVPPSPRTPSVTRIPRTLVGQTMPVGWNCVISMSMRSAPASSAMPWPSPVYSHEFEVIFQALPTPPVVEELAAAHGVAEVDLPVVLLPHVAQRRRDPALGHHGVRLPEERLAHQGGLHAHRARLDRRAQTRTARADHDHVVVVGLVL